MVEGGGGGGSGLVAVHDSAASWARGFSVRPRKWRRWGRGWTKKEEERAKERRRGGGGESDRGRAKEYERVGFAGSPLLIFPARLAASSFHFRSYTTLPPLSLSLPRLTTFLHLSPSSYSRSSFFLPSSTLSFLLSFARHASSSCPLANSRDIFPQFYIYIYTVMCMHAQSHGNIQRIIDACKRSFLHPLLSSIGHWHPDSRTLSCTLVEIGEVGRGLQPRFRLIGDDRLAREKQVLFPDFLFFFSNSIPHVFPSIRFRNRVVGVEGGAQRFFFLPSSFSSAT